MPVFPACWSWRAAVSARAPSTSFGTARRYIEKLNMPSTLQAAGVNAAEFEEAVHDMAEAALADRCTATNPRSCTAEEIEQIFRKAYSGKLP